MKTDLKECASYIIKTIIIFFFLLATIHIVFLKQNLLCAFDDKIVVFTSVFFTIFIMLINLVKNKINIDFKFKGNLFKFFFIALIFIMQIVFAVLIYRNIGFDCSVVVNTAIDMANGIFTQVEYFSKYSNNIFLMLLLEGIFRVVKLFGVTNYLLVAIIFNIIVVDLAIILINLTCKKTLKNNYKCIDLFFTIPMLAFTPYIGVVYSDTLSLIFTIAILYFYICYKESAKVKNLVATIIFSTIGLLLKPTNIIILIAIVIIESINVILSFLKNRKESGKKILKNICKNILISAVSFLTIYSLYMGYRDLRLNKYISKSDYENNGFPFTHFIMMGLKPTEVEGKYYGLYREEDVIATQQQIGIANKKEYNISEIKNRLNKLGIKGYVSYLYDKYTFIISDGTFFYGNEGSFYTSPPCNSSELAQKIQYYVYVDKEGYIKYTRNIMQGIWTSVIIVILIDTILNFRKKESDYINISRLALIGIIMFILIFEARSRYLINYLPIFVIVWSYSMSNIINFIEENIEKKGRKRLNEA